MYFYPILLTIHHGKQDKEKATYLSIFRRASSRLECNELAIGLMLTTTAPGLTDMSQDIAGNAAAIK